MKKILIVLVLLLFPISVSAGEGFEINDFSYKVIKQPAPGFIEVAFKVDVENDDIPGSIYVELKGVDFDEYEILSHIFREQFDSNERKTLTANRTFDAKAWKKVSEWIIYNSGKFK